MRDDRVAGRAQRRLGGRKSARLEELDRGGGVSAQSRVVGLFHNPVELDVVVYNLLEHGALAKDRLLLFTRAVALSAAELANAGEAGDQRQRRE